MIELIYKTFLCTASVRSGTPDTSYQSGLDQVKAFDGTTKSMCIMWMPNTSSFYTTMDSDSVAERTADSKAYRNRGNLKLGSEFDRRMVLCILNFVVLSTSNPEEYSLRIMSLTSKGNLLKKPTWNKKTSTITPFYSWNRMRYWEAADTQPNISNTEVQPENIINATSTQSIDVTKMVQFALANGHSPIGFVIEFNSAGGDNLIADTGTVQIQTDNVSIGDPGDQFGDISEPSITYFSTQIKGPQRTQRHGIWRRLRAFV